MLPSWTLWPWETPTLEGGGKGVLSPRVVGAWLRPWTPGQPASRLPCSRQEGGYRGHARTGCHHSFP